MLILQQLKSITLFMILLTANRCGSVPVLQNAVPDSYLAVQGSTVHYTCNDGFTPLSSLPQLTVCDGVNWTPTRLPGCGSKHKFSYDSTVFLRRLYIKICILVSGKNHKINKNIMRTRNTKLNYKSHDTGPTDKSNVGHFMVQFKFL